MNRFVQIIQRERLYILLLIFVILMTAIVLMPPGPSQKPEKQTEEMGLKREEAQKVFAEKRYLALLFSLTSLLIIAAFVLGIIIDAMLFLFRIAGNKLGIQTHSPPSVRWNAWDVAKVVVLFLFFGYITVMIESLLARTFPILKNDNFRMIVNSSILDILSVVFILYFTLGQYKERLITLGLSLKNFTKNVFYGIVGYLAILPTLVAILIITVIVTNLIKYVPEKQPVVELFLKEKDVAFLAFTSLFAAIVGPMIEELFFRGFMYSALKKYIGIFWSMLFTACVFAALHTNVIGFLPILVIGILLAYLYEKTGTLVSSITVHIIHNLSMVLFVFLIKELKV